MQGRRPNIDHPRHFRESLCVTAEYLGGSANSIDQRILNIRYDPSNSKHNANETPISKRLAAVYPPERHNQACLKVANDGAADRPSLVYDDELRARNQASQHAALR